MQNNPMFAFTSPINPLTLPWDYEIKPLKEKLFDFHQQNLGAPPSMDWQNLGAPYEVWQNLC